MRQAVTNSNFFYLNQPERNRYQFAFKFKKAIFVSVIFQGLFKDVSWMVKKATK